MPKNKSKYLPTSYTGWHDYYLNNPFPIEYDAWDKKDQHAYENGRQRAANYKLAFNKIPPEQPIYSTYKRAVIKVGAAYKGRGLPISLKSLSTSQSKGI